MQIVKFSSAKTVIKLDEYKLKNLELKFVINEIDFLNFDKKEELCIEHLKKEITLTCTW